MPFWSLCANATEIDDQVFSDSFQYIWRPHQETEFSCFSFQQTAMPQERDKAFKNVTLSGLSGFSEGHNVVPAETEI